MRAWRTGRLLLLAWAVALAACGPQPATTSQTGEAQSLAAVDTQANRVVTIIGRTEPTHLAEPGLRASGTSVSASTRPFNAQLDRLDAKEQPVAYLAEALPQLGSDTWQVFPDGRMETRYVLRPNVTWHDGTALSAEDFAFAFRVYSQPELGATASSLRADVESVTAPDPRTVVFHWKHTRPEALALAEVGSALPRHILGDLFTQQQWEPFLAHPYWTREFVGLGPYKLVRWEPGAFIEGEAWAGHVWGKPKIGRVIIRWTTDENTALANLLAGTVEFVTDLAIRFEQAETLQTSWAPTNGGTVASAPSQSRFTYFQLRPEIATPRALTDVRVRRAVSHAVDRQALNEALFNGKGIMTESLIRPSESSFAEVERSITRYAYDPRKTEELMREAGFTKGADGVFVDASGTPFKPELMNQPGAQPERESAVMRETWRRAGIDTELNLVLSTNVERRALFPGLQTGGGGVALEGLTTSAIGTAANRYAGNNRGGWSNPEYDRIFEQWKIELNPTARDRIVGQLKRLQTESVPYIPLFFNPVVAAYVADLQGLDRDPSNTSNLVWNIHQWEFR